MVIKEYFPEKVASEQQPKEKRGKAGKMAQTEGGVNCKVPEVRMGLWLEIKLSII